MNKIAFFSAANFSINFYESHSIKALLLWLLFSVAHIENTTSQTFFSPNDKVKIDQNKINGFIKSVPEISLKANYYNISIPVLETILVLQSNSGTSASDGQYNYGKILVHPELSAYPAFSKSKNGFILCTTRSRGAEAIALSLSLLRNDGKNSITDVQWLNLVFGPKGDLNSIAQQADEIYTFRTGKSFAQIGFQQEGNKAVAANTQSITQVANEIYNHEESTSKTLKSEELNTKKPAEKVQDEVKNAEKKPAIPPVKEEEMVKSTLPDKEIDKVFTPSTPVKDSLPYAKWEKKSITKEETKVLETKVSVNTTNETELKNLGTVEKMSISNESNPATVSLPESKNPTNVGLETTIIQPTANTVSQTSTMSYSPMLKLYGPTDKGTQLLGGSASFVRSNGNSILTINPNIGSFVANNIAIGLNHFYAAKLDGDYSDINAFGPYLKFYLGSSQKGKVFAQISGALAVVNLDFDNVRLSYGARAGYAVFINNSIALEFSGGYDKVKNGVSIFGGNVGFQIHYNKKEKTDYDPQQLIEYPALPLLSSTDAYTLGYNDAKQYYKGYKGAGTGTLITSLVSPLLGLIPAIACSSTRPKEINLDYPNPNFMQNSDYYKGYTDKAKKIKKKKVWTNWWIGLGANIIAIVILTSGK